MSNLAGVFARRRDGLSGSLPIQLMALKPKYTLIALCGLSAFAGALLVFCTPWGIGLSPDSAVYIGAARSISVGLGFGIPIGTTGVAPVIHYPPFYSFLLAGFDVTGLNILEGARWLNAALFVANTLLAGVMVFAATGSFPVSFLAALFMISALPMAMIHTMAWSEPVSIFLMFLGIALLATWAERQSRTLLILSATIFGLSALARYAGIALITAGAIGVVLLGEAIWKSKLRDSAVFLAISSLPIALWLARNLYVAGSATNRRIGYYASGLEPLGTVIDTASSWVLPSSVPVYTRGAVLLLFVLLLVPGMLLLKKTAADASPRQRRLTALAWLWSIFAVSYMTMVLAAVSFLDAQMPLDNRMLSPLYPALMLLALPLAFNLASRVGSSGRSRQVGFFLALLICGLQVVDTAPWLVLTHRAGVGYASRQWKQSELIKRLDSVAPAAVVVSNAPDVIYTLAGRSSDMIPKKINPDTRLPNENFSREIAHMKTKLRMRDGVLVYFNKIDWRWYLPTENELLKIPGLRLAARVEDGSIYRAD